MISESEMRVTSVGSPGKSPFRSAKYLRACSNPLIAAISSASLLVADSRWPAISSCRLPSTRITEAHPPAFLDVVAEPSEYTSIFIEFRLVEGWWFLLRRIQADTVDFELQRDRY